MQTPRVGGARWKAAGDTVGRGKRQEWQGEGENERKERREGTRWEHVSHTEIVNYSFVPRRVGVIWRRDGAGRGRVSRRRHGWRKKTVSRGTGENNAYAHARMGEREKDAPGCARRDAGERTRRCISCFIGPLRPNACHGGGVGGCAVACAREGEETKNEDEVNDIHAGYRILPSRAPSAATIFSPSFFFPPLGRSPALSASHFLRLSSLSWTPPHDFSYFT